MRINGKISISYNNGRISGPYGKYYLNDYMVDEEFYDIGILCATIVIIFEDSFLLYLERILVIGLR